MYGNIYNNLQQNIKKGRKNFALLIDPDKHTGDSLAEVILLAKKNGVDLIFVGGSLLVEDKMRWAVRIIKNLYDVPVLLFPGSGLQITPEADGILFLSLISGRNPDLLIGRHVEAAPLLKQTNLEVLPTGYLLVDCGKPTTASYISNTQPIPYDKPDIAACTAMAGEMLGLKLMYMDGGSGAAKPISPEMIRAVKQNINVPLIVGGGIRTKQELQQALIAGADVVVVGNAIEKDPELLAELRSAVESGS